MEKHGEDYWIDLGRRWVAAGCKWMPGMRAIHPYTGGIRVLATDAGDISEEYVVLPDGDGNCVMRPYEWAVVGRFDHGLYGDQPFVPDLRDAPTVGALLAEVREAWGDPGAYASLEGDDWWGVCCEPIPNEWHNFSGKTEAEALVVAREAAPPRKGGDQ